ncbi:MAG: PAS domain S-box protein, partial [Anaerolineae bacterium]
MVPVEYNQHFMFRNLADLAPILIWMSDAAGNTVFFNKAWLQFSGRTLEQELATHWAQRIHPEDYPACDHTFQTAIQMQQGFRAEFRLRRADGQYCWVVDDAVPLFQPDNTFAGLAGFCTDVTAQKQAQAREEEQRTYSETLANITLSLTSSIELDAVLDEILRQTERLFHHEATNIALVEGEKLHIARWSGYSRFGGGTFVDTLTYSLELFPVVMEVVQSRKTKIIDDTRAEPGWHTVLETEWVRSYAGVPITFQDRVLGLLQLDSAEPKRFSLEDTRRLEPLTNAAAIALANAQLYEQAQREIAERKRAEEVARNLNLRLEHRVHERTAELAAANESLKELDRLKSKFVADVSHELRTPISVLSLK